MTCSLLHNAITHVSLLLADDDGRLEMNVDDDQKLVVTRLEEEVLDVVEQDVCKLKFNTSSHEDMQNDPYRSYANFQVTCT
jgi:hypothetical protein